MSTDITANNKRASQNKSEDMTTAHFNKWGG